MDTHVQQRVRRVVLKIGEVDFAQSAEIRRRRLRAWWWIASTSPRQRRSTWPTRGTAPSRSRGSRTDRSASRRAMPQSARRAACKMTRIEDLPLEGSSLSPKQRKTCRRRNALSARQTGVAHLLLQAGPVNLRLALARYHTLSAATSPASVLPASSFGGITRITQMNSE